MGDNVAFAAQLAERMKRYGTNYSSSRLSNLQLQIFDEAETFMANFTGAAAAVTVSSGYLAGQMVVKALQHQGHFIYAPGTHPAVWLDVPVWEEPNYNSWVAGINDRIGQSPRREVVIVCNSLDPLLVRKHDFNWMNHIPSSHSVTMLIDDSHGFGIIGREGAGIFTELTLPSHIRLAVITSFGKAFGIPGGVVLGDQPFIDQLRKSLFFSASSPVIPAYLFAFLQSAEIYRKARIRLLNNIAHFSEQIGNLGLFQTFPDYPVFYSPDNHLHDYLQERQVLISCFPYPSPQDSCITRVVLSSLHTPEDIDRLATLIRQYANEQPKQIS